MWVGRGAGGEGGAAAGAPPGMPALTPETAKMVCDGHQYGESCVGGRARRARGGCRCTSWYAYLDTSGGQDGGWWIQAGRGLCVGRAEGCCSQTGSLVFCRDTRGGQAGPLHHVPHFAHHQAVDTMIKVKPEAALFPSCTAASH